MSILEKSCWRKSRVYILAAVLIVIGPLNFYFTTKNYSAYLTVNGREDPRVCLRSRKQIDDLRALVRDTHIVLDEANIPHMLIEGSLWGALRYKDVLPWDFDFDMALFARDLRGVDREKLRRSFLVKDIIMVYQGPWSAQYKVYRNNARGDLAVYSQSLFDKAKMVRSAFERYLLYFQYAKYYQFPSRLAEEPLPKMMFCGMNISVPREGNEIQKHFYPDDWWIEAKPNGCK